MIRKLLYFFRSIFLIFSDSSGKKTFSTGLGSFCLGMFMFLNIGYCQILQRGTSTASTTGNNVLTIAKPNTVVAGDVMIVNIAQVNSINSNSLSNPTSNGWTLIKGASLTTSGNPRWGAILYKIATASEPLNYIFTLSSRNNGGVGAIVAFSGVDVSGSPFYVASSGINTPNTNTTTATATTITPTSNYAAVIMFAQAANSAPTWSNWSTTSPGTLTELYDEQNTVSGNGNSTIGAAWGRQTTATSTTGTVDLSSGQRNGAVLLALKPLTYKSQIISINAGATTWCPGETRNVEVVIKNTGTATWTDGANGSPDINIGVKWNTSGASWTDYHSRIDAGNLAPGVTRTYNLPITASNNDGFGYSTAFVGGTSNNLIFDVVYEGPFWFASNINGAGPGNNVFTSQAQTILAAPANKTIAAANSSICSGSNTNITVSSSEVGVNYQLRDASNSLIGSAVAGTNGTISLPTGNLTGTTTFNVLASSCGNSVQMPGTVTVNVSQPPTISNAGPDQTLSGSSFTLAANAPTVGTGAWSIVSGPSSLLGQFVNINSPTTVFNRATAGTYVLRWTISNGSVCSTSTDDVVIANCVSNLIVNGDFSGSAAAWSPATSAPGSVVEINQETTYFSTGNSDATAELDGAASLRQSVTVVPGVSYTLSFLYARRPGAPDPVAVDIKIIGGSNPASAYFSTSSVTTPQTGSFTFTPTNSPIAIEFYNSLAGSATYGTIIDNIVLLPTTQVSPIATTIPKGTYKTLTACVGSSVLLDVDNVSATGVTYSWTTTSSGVSFTSATNIKSPTVTLSGTGLKEFKVIATTAGGCASSSSSTFIYVIAVPTVFNVTGAGSYCVGGSGVLVGLNASTSGISYQLQKDGINIGTAVTGPTSGAAISFGSQTAAGTYTVVAKNTTTNCTSNMNGVVTINPKPVILDMTSTTCSGNSFTVTPVNGGGFIVPANTTYSWGLPSGTGFTGGAINSGTPLNITGNLVNTTTVNQTAVYTVTPTSSGCPGTPFKVTVTITPTNAVGAASSTPTLCIDVPLTNSTYVTHMTTGATGIGSPSNLPTGLSAAWSANIITISGTPTASGTFAYSIPLVGGCGTVSATGSITISPATVGGTAASVSCYTTSSNTATITLSGQTGNVIRWESSTDNFVSTPATIANTTTSLSGINVSTTTYYRAVVQSGTCATSNSSIVKLVPGIAPTANNATLPTCNGFTANWTKVNEATSYLLSISDDNFASTLSGYTNSNVGDINSFSVTGLLPNKTYQYILKSVFSCGNYAAQSNVIVITTADLPITGTFTGGAPVICVGSSTTFSNSTPGGVWSVTNGSGTANVTTNGEVTGGTVGDVTVVYTVTNGSCSNSISRALTINPLLIKPSVGETIGVGCSNLGSVTLNNLPAGNWTLYQTGTASNNFNNTTLSETSYTITGLAVGTYYFAVNNGTCTSAQTTAVDITDQTSTSWNGTKWSNDPPTPTKNAIIESVNPNQPFATDAFACSLTINAGVVVTVPTGITLTITNAITTNG
ncbi:PKD-like domain-containing protein, partial [Flavobacterium sp. CSZ]|uniref:beta strand repeat-containing protein n=1 Tax=Flavobacterium sp. CSZ TaxID=2783791 RepID=UPI00188B7142